MSRLQRSAAAKTGAPLMKGMHQRDGVFPGRTRALGNCAMFGHQRPPERLRDRVTD